MSKIKLAIIDDEGLFVEGLSILLGSVYDILITSSDGQDFLSKLSNVDRNEYPQIALVDINMKPMSGFDLVSQLKDQHPEIKVIVISSHYTENVLGHMIKLGISAFIPKTSSKDKLVQVINSVNEHGIYFSKSDHKLLHEFMNKKNRLPNLFSEVKLTKRELEILKEICLEQTNQEIASKLFISKRTVESHRQRILEKVGARNSVGLVMYAVVHRILPLPQI